MVVVKQPVEYMVVAHKAELKLLLFGCMEAGHTILKIVACKVVVHMLLQRKLEVQTSVLHNSLVNRLVRRLDCIV